MNETMRTTSRSYLRGRAVSDMAGVAWKSAARNVSLVIPCELHLANKPVSSRRQVRRLRWFGVVDDVKTVKTVSSAKPFL